MLSMKLRAAEFSSGMLRCFSGVISNLSTLLNLIPIPSATYPIIIPTTNPTRLTTANAVRLAATSASSEAPNNTNDPSPNVVMNAANKPPKVRLPFLYMEAATMVPPHPGTTPNKAPIIGCAHLGPIRSLRLNFSREAKLINAKPIIEIET